MIFEEGLNGPSSSYFIRKRLKQSGDIDAANRTCLNKIYNSGIAIKRRQCKAIWTVECQLVAKGIDVDSAQMAALSFYCGGSSGEEKKCMEKLIVMWSHNGRNAYGSGADCGDGGRG